MTAGVTEVKRHVSSIGKTINKPNRQKGLESRAPMTHKRNCLDFCQIGSSSQGKGLIRMTTKAPFTLPYKLYHDSKTIVNITQRR